jgi:iron complex outermembrane receptor protein
MERQLSSRKGWLVPALSGLVMTLAAGGALAQEPEGAGTGSGPQKTEERPVVKQEIVVSASLPELAAERVLTARDLEDRAESDIGEALRSEAGLSAVRRGPVNLEPTVRGLQENQVGMFVDGTRTFAAGPGRMDSDLSHVSPHAVRGVQVVKGPYALTWGAGTLSAVQLETASPPFSAGGFEFAGRLGYNFTENTGAGDGHVALSGSGERTRFSLFLNDRRGDDYEAGDGSTVPGDYASSEARWTVDARLGGDRGLLEYSGGYQEQSDIDYPGRLLDATYFYTRSQSLKVTWSSLFAQVYSNRKDHRMNNDEKPTALPAPGRIPPFPIRVDLPTESNTTGARIHGDVARGAWDWRFGGDWYLSQQTAQRTVSRRDLGVVLFQDIVWPDAEIEDLGVYGRGLHRGDGYQVGVAVRLDRVDASAGEVSPFFRANTEGDLDQEETHLSAAVSAQWQLGEGLLLSLGAGRAVRTATASERYSDRFPATKFQLAAEFLGNPALDPEESLELDVGLELRRGGWGLALDLFHRRIEDYITVEADPTVPRRLPLSPPVVYRYINGEAATFRGGELRLRHEAGGRVEWWASLQYVWAEDETFDEPVLGIAPLTVRLGVRITPTDRLWVAAQATLADDQDRVATTRFERPTEGFEIFDLRAAFRISQRLQLRAGVENLFDEAYAEHLNAPNPFLRQRILEPGRRIYGGVELRF